jgi:thiol-disulfide isomerase/thioredoxin
MSDKNLIIGVAGLLIVIAVGLYATGERSTPGTATTEPAVSATSSPVAAFAQCLKDSGAVFYGAFWCPHCKTQKALFGNAVSLLPYVECSTADGNAQTAQCIAKKIKGYPTWEFADGSRLDGEQSFAQLSEKTQCPVPAS